VAYKVYGKEIEGLDSCPVSAVPLVADKPTTYPLKIPRSICPNAHCFSWHFILLVIMATRNELDTTEKVLQMPDPVTEELLGKLKIVAEKNGVEFDPKRMTTDMGYAYQMLMELGDTHDQIQGLVVMQMLRHLGLLDLSDGMSE
jgi:hypothetical protein